MTTSPAPQVEPLIYYSPRSLIVDREECGRMRFLKADLDGTGYEAIPQSVPTLSGTRVHDGFALVVGGKATVDAAVTAANAAYQDEVTLRGLAYVDPQDLRHTFREQAWMMEVLLRAWVLLRLPVILEDYEVVSCEQQWFTQLADGIRQPIRMDVILRRKADGMLFILDFKTTPYGDDNWAMTHQWSRQTLLYIEALERETQERVGGIIYEGLVRGQFKKDTAKSSPWFGKRIQQTALCYGYWLEGDSKEESLYQATYTSRKGWKKMFAGDHFTAEGWIAQLQQEGILRELFITMDPVCPPPEARGRLVEQIAQAEQHYVYNLRLYERMVEKLGEDHPTTRQQLGAFAPQETSRCFKFGADHRCPFIQDGICFMPDSLQVLRSDPAFQPRVSHHQQEE
jgi:hypothetical protein